MVAVWRSFWPGRMLHCPGERRWTWPVISAEEWSTCTTRTFTTETSTPRWGCQSVSDSVLLVSTQGSFKFDLISHELLSLKVPRLILQCYSYLYAVAKWLKCYWGNFTYLLWLKTTPSVKIPKAKINIRSIRIWHLSDREFFSTQF